MDDSPFGEFALVPPVFKEPAIDIPVCSVLLDLSPPIPDAALQV
jgi:hypothetical protein